VGEMKKGIFIVFEGLDGCGKSIQIAMLRDWLKKKRINAIATKEPTANITGNILKLALRMEKLSPVTDTLLFAADRAEHIDKVIRENLKKGKVIIQERYVYANLAYQTAQGVSERFVKNVNDFAVRPDLVFLLDLPAEMALQRNWNVLYFTPGKFEKSIQFNDKVRKKYLELAKKFGMHVIDATKPQEEIFEEVVKKVNQVL
jgi:dTMP kinase